MYPVYKFVYFTDSQADDRILSNRKDKFEETILCKFKEIIDVANYNNCDIICGGDLLDRPYISYSFLGKLIDVLKFNKNKFLLILGNHDIVGRNLESYERSGIGILEKSGVVTILSSSITKEGFSIVPIHYNETHKLEEYNTKEWKTEYGRIVVSDPVTLT